MALSSNEKSALDAVGSYVDEILSEGESDAGGQVVIQAIPQYGAASPAIKASVKQVYLTVALAMMRAGLTA